MNIRATLPKEPLRTRTTNGAIEPETVLVVLPALNEEAHIERCIRSLFYPPEWMARTLIVVADGGSTDRTKQIVASLSDEFGNIELVNNPGKLQSAGVNAAVERAALPGYHYMVRCDVHAVYPSGYVRDVVRSLEDHDAASVATPLDATGDSPLQRAAAWIVDTPLGSGGSAHRGGCRSGFVDHGHHAGFRLDWFRRMGGYDPTFSHNEDAEYDHRLAKAGGRVWLDAGIRIDYVMRPTLRGLARQYWHYGRGRARTIVKHQMRPRLRQLLPALNTVFLCVSAAAGLAWAPASLWCASYLTLVVAVSLTGLTLERSFAGLLAGPALAAMHIGWGLGFLCQLALEYRQRG